MKSPLEILQLPDSFWQSFVRQHFEDQPTVLRQPFARQFVTDAELMEVITRASEDVRTRQRDVPLTVNVDGGTRKTDLDAYLPRTEDRSVVEFGRRIESQLSGSSLGLIYYGCQYYSVELFDRARTFLQGLYQVAGMPKVGADLDVFLGNYDRTPAGIHTDFAANFSFVVSGTKKMVLWPRERFRSVRQGQNGHRLLGRGDWENLRDGAVILEGEPGDVLYWPASYWHIAVSDGGWTATMNLALYVEDSDPSALAHEALTEACRDSTSTPLGAARTLPWSAATAPVPNEIVEERQRLQAALSSIAFERALLSVWLNRTTAHGFRVVPPPEPIVFLPVGSRVRGRSLSPIRCLVHDGRMLVSCNGYGFVMVPHPHLIALLDRITQREPLLVSSLLREHSFSNEGPDVEIRPEDIHALLSQLWSMRALEKDDAP